MNAKTVFSTALVLTAFSFGAVLAQPPSSMSALDTVPPPAGTGSNGDVPQPQQQTSTRLQLSSWIRGDKYDCCGGCGSSGPIQTELFIRFGPSIPFGNGAVAEALTTGYYLGGGGRALFFDPTMCHAWTVELGLANIYNHAPSNRTETPLFLAGQTAPTFVTLEGLTRTFFDLGVGHEWYVWGSAGCHGPSWRVGCDGGGRYGTARADLHEIQHRSDVIGGVWAAAHTDLEIPCGCCIFQAGFRVEYGYTWSDILQIQNKSDVQDINILLSMGVRF